MDLAVTIDVGVDTVVRVSHDPSGRHTRVTLRPDGAHLAPVVMWGSDCELRRVATEVIAGLDAPVEMDTEPGEAE